MSTAFRTATVVTLMGALTGCARRPEGAGRDSSSVTILYAGSDEWVLGPSWDDSPKFLVFLPLVETNERGDPEGRLAERWSHSPDFREWTFHLRQGVRWHDGVPVTAHDIEFTLDLYKGALSRETPSAYRVHVLDDSTLTIAYPEPPRDPFHTWKVFWPKHLLERLNPNQILTWDFWVHPVGDGPYRYVRHVPKTMIELKANPDFYAGKPKIQRVILKLGGGTAIAELLSGNVDVVDGFNPADLPRLAADPRFRMYYYVDIGLKAIFWNHRSPLFSNALVRQALTLGIDRAELRRAMNLPEDLLITDALFTMRQYRRHELAEPLPYDPDSAKRVLDAAGWRDDDGNGVRERGGREFRFVALVRHGMIEEQMAIYVQAQLRRIGLRMDIQTVEGSVIWPRLRDGLFEAAVFPFVNEIGSQLRWLGDNSPLGYANPQVIALLRAASIAADPEESDRIYRDLMPLMRADLPVTFLLPVVHTVVAHRRVRGLRSPLEADPVMQMEHLWLESGR